MFRTSIGESPQAAGFQNAHCLTVTRARHLGPGLCSRREHSVVLEAAPSWTRAHEGGIRGARATPTTRPSGLPRPGPARLRRDPLVDPIVARGDVDHIVDVLAPTTRQADAVSESASMPPNTDSTEEPDCGSA
jgi:hypothetical protein